MKEIAKKINFPMYRYTVTIIMTDDIEASRSIRSEEIGAFYKKKGFTTGLCSSNADTGQSFIFITPQESLSTLVHETNHAVWAMMEFIGADLESEIFAYTQKYLFEKGEKLIRKWNRKHGLNQ